ncbi:MAG TPA: hypothetical protein VFI37_10735 [Gaiellaceae bacterium]|nr:hypothetical protein [Gaiellaceae bacterium]
MGAWYLIGLLAGIGAALGVLFSGMLGTARSALPAALVLAAALAVGIGFAVDAWGEALAGGLGAVAGVAGARQVVAGALRRGGTRGGTAALVGLAALVVAGLAFVPALGYLEALALPALGARLRARAGERYAGLRILARD